MIPHRPGRPRPNPSGRRTRTSGIAAVLLAVLTLPACEPPGGRAGGDDGETDATGVDSPHPRAAYLTSLTFVGFETSPSLVHLRFENLADRNRLALSYQGWVAGRSEWSQILGIEDTIPVARAAWRVVPVDGLRMRVGSGAQIEAVRIPLDGTPLRLEALDAISSWSSSTGQRETLRSAELLLGQRAEAGLLLQRRRARALEMERVPSPSQAFVLTDTVGSGLIVLRNRAVPEAPAMVWAWLDGERMEWSDALLIGLTPAEGSPGRWSLEIAREGIVVEVEAATPLLDSASGTSAAYRLYPVRATLSIGEERRTMAGVGIEDDGP